jgi:ribosomal protein L19
MMGMVSLQELKIKDTNTQLYKIIRSGRVFYFDYLLIEHDEIRTVSFIGLCILIRKKSNTVQFKNLIKKERVSLTLHAHSPLIAYVQRLKRYR